MALSAFGQAYSDALKDLTSAELAKIKLLRDLAKENPGEAFNIMQALVKHAYECPEVHRLPALYLMDCMLKSADAPYPELLAGVIVEVFAFIWDGARPDIRSKLARMAGTWRHPVPFLPADVMAAITQKMQPPQAAPLQPAPLQQQSLVCPGQLLAPTVAQAAPNVPAVAVPGSLPPHLQQQFGQQATSMAPYGPVAMAGRPGAGYAPVQHMPSFTQGLQAAYGGPTLAVAPAAVVAVPAPAVNQAVPSAAGMASLLSSLGAFAASAAAAAPVRSAGSSGGGSGGSAQQDKAQAAVDALFAASDLTKRKFLDLQFLRNRRLQASTYLVRPWFVKIEQWLEGTRTAEEAPAHFFEEPSQPKELPPVEEDPSQPTCAISGEAFDRTYDPDTDKWYYDDAVVLTAEQAAAYGVMEGSIVKSSCLAGAPPAVLVAQGIQGSSAAQYTNKTRTPDAPVGQTVSATPSPPGKRAYADAKPLGVQQPDLKRIRVDG